LPSALWPSIIRIHLLAVASGGATQHQAFLLIGTLVLLPVT
jgi:hypothetical protein